MLRLFPHPGHCFLELPPTNAEERCNLHISLETRMHGYDTQFEATGTPHPLLSMQLNDISECSVLN